MSQIIIDVGSAPDDGTGDPIRDAFIAVNNNFTQIFSAGPVTSNIRIANNTITTTVINGNIVLAPSGIGVVQTNTTVMPRIDDVYDLGAPTQRFNTLYLGTGGFDSVGNITGNYFIGNGSLLTGVLSTPGPNIVFGNTAVAIPFLDGPVLTRISGILAIDVNAANTRFLTPVVANTITANVVSASTIIGNISGRIIAPGLDTQVLFNQNGNVDGANGLNYFSSNGSISVAGTARAFNVTASNLVTANTLITTANANIGDSLFVNQFLNVGGNAYVFGNLEVFQDSIFDRDLDVSGNIEANNINTQNLIRGGDLDILGNTTLVGTVQTGALTATTLSATGNAQAANLSVTGTISAGSNISAANLTTAGNVVAVNINATNDVTAPGNLTAGNAQISNFTATTITSGNILPSANVTYDIGSPALRFRDIYLSGNTLDLNSATIESNATALILTNPVGGRFIVDGTGVSDNSRIQRGTSNVSIPTANAAVLIATGGTVRANVSNSGLAVTGNITASGNTAAGNVSVTGNIIAGNANIAGITTVNNLVITGNSNVTGNTNVAGNLAVTGNITANSNITAVGNVTSGNINTGSITANAAITTTGNINGHSINTGSITANSTITATGNITANSVTTGSITANSTITATGNITANSVTTGSITANSTITATGNVSGGNIATAGTVQSTTANVGNATIGNATVGNMIIGNITGNLQVTQDAVIEGNLTVNGNVTYVNVQDLNVEDPILGLGRGANNTPLTTNDGKDRGEQLWYYSGSEKSAFIGYDNSGGNLIAAVDASITNEIVTVNSFGNFVAGNVVGGNLITAGLVSATGNVVGGNITTVGNVQAANVNATSAITATGNVSGGNIATAGQITATGNVTGGNITAIGNVSGVGAVFSGNVTAANFIGNIQGNVDAGGANTQIQFNDADILAGSPAFTFNRSSNLVAATGNVSAGNLVTAGRVDATGNVTGGNVTTAGRVDATGNVTGGNVTTTGRVDATGNVAGGNVTTAGRVDATGNVTGGNVTTTGQVTATGNVTGGNVTATGNVTAAAANIAGNIVSGANIRGANLVATANVAATGNVSASYFIGNGALLSGIDTTLISSGNSNVKIVAANGNATVNISGTSNVAVFANTGAAITGTLTVSGNITGGNLSTAGTGGNITGANVVSANTFTAAANVDAANISSTGAITATGNITGGNLVTAGRVDATGNVTGGNITTVGEITATGNITGNNVVAQQNVAVLGNKITSGTTTGIEFAPGNVSLISGNIIVDGGRIYSINGDSAIDLVYNGEIGSVGVYNNLTVGADGEGNLTVQGTSNLAGNTSVAGTVTVSANITAANLTANSNIVATGNITANNTLLAGNVTTTGAVSATGDVTAGNLITAGNVAANTVVAGSDLSLVSTGNVVFTSGGNIVNVGGSPVINVGYPDRASAAATKQYVDDAVSSGIHIHDPVDYEQPGPLPSATYAQGGTVYTVIETVAGNTVVFSTAANLQPNDQLWFTTSFSGIVANTSYFVVSAPNTSAAVLSTDYEGEPVSNITSASGLTESVRVNSGIGATLTATANGALSVDSVAVSVGNRVLIYEEANAVHNGVYVVSDTGNATAPWILTRATDSDQYAPNSNDGMDDGSYYFVKSGATGAGESYVLTAPIGEYIIGYANVEFTQFSSSVAYSANSQAGIDLTGTTFSAKIDDNTTAFDGSGNIIVKAGANLTTPNIGVAAGTSLSLTGNIQGNNLSLGNTVSASSASITGNVSAGNFTTAGQVVATGNLSGNGLTLTNGANIAGNIDATGNALFGQPLSFVATNANMQYAGTANSFVQFVVQNKSNGSSASADLVATPDNGTDNDTYVTMGINSSGYSETAYSLQAANDGYLYVSGNTTTGGGNLVISTLTNRDIVFSTNGAATGNEIARLQHGNGLVVTGIVSATGNISGGNITTAGNATAAFFIGDGSQLSNLSIIAGSSIENGNSNVTVAANGNVTVGTYGTTATTFANTGVYVTGVVSASGNISGGNVNAANEVIAVGNVSANYFLGNGACLTGVITSVANINNGNSNVAIAVADGNVAVAVNGVAEIAVFADSGVYVTGVITANGNITGDTFAANAAVISGNLEAEYANITTTAGMDISGGNLRINELTGLGGELIAQGNVSGLNVNTGNINLTGNVLSNLWVDGNIAGGNAALSGNLEMTGGYLLLNELTGLGGELIAQGNVSGLNVNTGNINLTGNVLSNLWVDGNIAATNAVFSGQLDVTGANIDIVDVAAVGGNLNAIGATVSGNVTANYFLGNGACLTGVITSVANINNGTSNVEIATPDGNVAVTVDGTANVAVFANTGVSISGTVDATGNITGDVILGNAIDITNDAIIGGNLTVNGNVTYVNVEELNVEDPIIGLGRGPNNAPLTTDDGKDRGEQLWYYDSAEKSAFIGYDNSADKLIAALNVTVTNEVVTVSDYGNFVTGNLEAATVLTTGNITANYFVGNGSLLTGISSGGFTSANITGNVNPANSNNNGNIESTTSAALFVNAGNGIQINPDPANAIMTIQVIGSLNDGTLWGGGGSAGNITTVANIALDDGLVIDAVTSEYDLGNALFPRQCYVIVDTTPPANPRVGDIWIDTNTGINYLYFNDGDSSQWAEMTGINQFNSVAPYWTGNIIPGIDNTFTLGNATNRWANVWVGSLDISGLNLAGTITGNLTPSANITYDLGNTTNRWNDIWLANSTIHIGAATISATGANLVLPATVQIGNAVLDASSGNLALPENITANTVTASGDITANSYIGDGSQLTGISAGITTGKAIAMSIVFGG